MLTDDDRRRVKELFGVDDDQVRRDHLISHALAAFSQEMPDRIRFFGGTALSRSFLTSGRLSEDIDLIAIGPRPEIAELVTTTLTHSLAREFGRPTFVRSLADVRPEQPVTASFPSGSTIQIHLLPDGHYPLWPFESIELEQRYSDAGCAVLQVPTLPAFVAWKTTTYIDRRASRDLWDLAALAAVGAYTSEAADLFSRHGIFTSLPTESSLPPAPSEEIWQRDLAHQTPLNISAAEARSAVLQAWRDVGDDGARSSSTR
jgi:hypothetical protein